MMRLYKKGLSPIGLLGEILIVLAVIVLLLAIVIVPRIFKQSDIVGVQIGGIEGDADKDSIRNLFDKCPCIFGDSLYEGCPATVTEEQKREDVKKYNSEPPCGITGEVRIGTTTVEHVGREKITEQKAEQKSEPAAFKNYRSIEIFGQDDKEFDGVIRQACTGFVGGKGAIDCHSEDNDCDGEFRPGPKALTEGCWIMASEEDGEGNDCGQAKVDDGTIIPSQGYRRLVVDLINHYSGDLDPKALFSRPWKSNPEYGYGALLCNKGLWYGCKEANEGRTLDVTGKTYKCTGSEWVKQ